VKHLIIPFERLIIHKQAIVFLSSSVSIVIIIKNSFYRGEVLCNNESARLRENKIGFIGFHKVTQSCVWILQVLQVLRIKPSRRMTWHWSELKSCQLWKTRLKEEDLFVFEWIHTNTSHTSVPPFYQFFSVKLLKSLKSSKGLLSTIVKLKKTVEFSKTQWSGETWLFLHTDAKLTLNIWI